MARDYLEEKVTYTRRCCSRLACDLCGREAKPPVTEGWETSSYEINETVVRVEVRCAEGESYPEGGHKREISIDICPVCFRDRLIPWLKSQGAKINEREVNW